MKQKIPCFCDTAFTVEVPEIIDLDAAPESLEEICKGTFFNFICPGCGKKHKPEFPLNVLWPSKGVRFEVCRELDRGEFYRKKKESSDKKDDLRKETVIGYPELAERILVYQDKLEPAVVEAIKYYLHLKAAENSPDRETDIWYNGISGDNHEFHIHGLKEDEVALMKIPASLYNKILEDYNKNPRDEIFSALRVRSYLSVRNMMINETLK